MRCLKVAAIVLTLALALAAPPLVAEEETPAGGSVLQTVVVEYRDGETVLEGYLAYLDSSDTRPGVLVVPSWTGVNAQAKASAERLAKMGYVALVADVYGKGVRPAHGAEAGKVAGKYKGDRPLTRSRMNAALARLREDPRVDKARIGAIGYCFGGMCVLELARSGADVAAVVSFHGSLDTPTPEEAGPIAARVLVCHGADDPGVPQEHVAAFVKEMQRRKAPFELIQYGGAVHSFTDENAGNDPSRGNAYHPVAARRAWAAMTGLFADTFAPPPK